MPTIPSNLLTQNPNFRILTEQKKYRNTIKDSARIALLASLIFKTPIEFNDLLNLKIKIIRNKPFAQFNKIEIALPETVLNKGMEIVEAALETLKKLATKIKNGEKVFEEKKEASGILNRRRSTD